MCVWLQGMGKHRPHSQCKEEEGNETSPYNLWRAVFSAVGVPESASSMIVQNYKQHTGTTTSTSVQLFKH